MTLLAAKGVRKHYGPVVALGGVDLSIEQGEFVTLLGPSGSGKTTLLMAIAGFAKLDAGSIVLAGADITAMEPEDRNFGFVFQGYALFPHMSVAQNIAFPLSVRKWPSERMKARVDEMLALVGLERLAARKPRELSGGQQQRVAIARALAFDPKILLLDEPLSALDRTLREQMQRELKRLHRQTGVTFIYVTHDQEEAIALSDRIAVFEQGLIVQVGTPRDLYYRPANGFVAGFLGVNNLFEGRVSKGGEIEALGARFKPAVSVDPAGTAATLWVRPEDLTLEAPKEPSVAFEAAVADLSFLGSFDRLILRTGDGTELIAQLPAERARQLEPGQTIQVHARLSAIGIVP